MGASPQSELLSAGMRGGTKLRPSLLPGNWLYTHPDCFCGAEWRTMFEELVAGTAGHRSSRQVARLHA